MELPSAIHGKANPEPGDMRRLDPAIRTVWAIKYMIFFGVLLIGALIYDVIGIFAANRWLIPGIATVLVLIVGGSISYFVPKFRYRFWRFELRQEELLLERGILNRVRTVVPLRRIQHLDVSQDILEREFSLGKLIVHTAGTRSSDVVLPGLRYEEAESLREAMKHYILEDTL